MALRPKAPPPPPYSQVEEGAILTDTMGMQYRVLRVYRRPLSTLPGAHFLRVFSVCRLEDMSERCEISRTAYNTAVVGYKPPPRVRVRTRCAPTETPTPRARVRKRKTDNTCTT